METKKVAVYPGTFDPITYGHLDLIRRACGIFDKLFIAVAENPPKKTLFSIKERLELVKEVLTSYTNKDKVEIASFDGLLVEFANKVNANVILRGLRAVSDFEYELSLASINRKLIPEIETVFMIPSEEYFYISSSLAKEIIKFGGNISKLVPPLVEEKLKNKFKK